MKHWLLLYLICPTSISFAAQEADLGCKHLRVVLNPDMVEQEWASGNPRTESPATLELVGCNGQLLDRFILAAPFAQLDPVPVHGAPNPTYLVSTDLTAEAGSYNGPLTIPVQIVHDHLVAAVARLTDKRIDPIRLTLTGKSAWRRVLNRNAEDLFLVNCQPKGKGFVTFYRHYFISHKEWKVTMSSQNGLWESDGEFPSRKLFR